MSKVEYIVEMELDVDFEDNEALEQLTEMLACYNIEVAGIAEDAGPINGDHLYFFRGTERMLVEMFREFAECDEEEVMEIMELAYAIN